MIFTRKRARWVVASFSDILSIQVRILDHLMGARATGQIAFHHPMVFRCTLTTCLAKFPALALAPRTVHVDQTPFEAGLRSMFMSSSTVKPLFLASSLSLTAVSFLTHTRAFKEAIIIFFNLIVVLFRCIAFQY